MAAKNFQTKNLTTAVSKAINDTIEARYNMTSGFREDLKAKHITTEYVRERSRHDEYAEKLQRQAQRTVRNVNDMQKKYNDLLAARLKMADGDATEALLAETRATKLWTRIERELNGKGSTAQLNLIEQRIRTAVQNGDYSTVAAINSEALDYLHVNGFKDPEKLIELIIRNEDSELASAYSDIVEAKKLRDITNYNVSTITKALDKDLATGLEGYHRDTSKIPHLVDPHEAVRSSHADAADELRAALDNATRSDNSTDISNPDSDVDDLIEQPDTTAQEPVAESRFQDNSLMSIGPNETI